MRWLSIALILSGCGGAAREAHRQPQSHAQHATPPRADAPTLTAVSYAIPTRAFPHGAELSDDSLWLATALGVVQVDLTTQPPTERLIATRPDAHPDRLQLTGGTLVIHWLDAHGALLEVIDLAHGMQRHLLPRAAREHNVALSADGRYVAYHTDDAVQVTEVEHWQHKTFPSMRGFLQLGDDARHLAIGDWVFDGDARRVWPTKEHAPLSISSNLFRWHGKDLLVYGAERSITLVDLESRVARTVRADCVDPGVSDTIDAVHGVLMRSCRRGQLLFDLGALHSGARTSPIRVKSGQLAVLDDGVAYVNPPMDSAPSEHALTAVDVVRGARYGIHERPPKDLGFGFTLQRHNDTTCILHGSVALKLQRSERLCSARVRAGRLLLGLDRGFALFDLRGAREIYRYGGATPIPYHLETGLTETDTYGPSLQVDVRTAFDRETGAYVGISNRYWLANRVSYTSAFVSLDDTQEAYAALAPLALGETCAPRGQLDKDSVLVECTEPSFSLFWRVDPRTPRLLGAARKLWAPSYGPNARPREMFGYEVIGQELTDRTWSEWALVDPASKEPQLWAMLGWDFAIFTDGARYQRFGDLEHAAAYLRCQDKDGILHPYAACAHDAPLF